MKKRKKRKLWLVPVLLIVLGILFVESEWMGRMIYPIGYKEEIRQNAEKYRVDPLLIAAIIRVESNFKPTAVSPKGALGIMQIMPDTAEWILKQDDFGKVTVEDVKSKVHAGVALGSWYLKDLHRQFDGNLPASLAAYNAGPGKVKEWIAEGVWDGTAETLRDIPYGETRHYVQRVMYYYNKYLKLYDGI